MSDVKAAALRLILKKRRTEKEVIDALVQRGYDEADAEDAARHYRKEGYINHLDYARRYAHDAAVLKGFGPQRITRALLERGVEEEYIEDALAKIHFDITAGMEKRFGSGILSAKEQNRIFQYYYRRGFRASDIQKAMDELYRYE